MRHYQSTEDGVRLTSTTQQLEVLVHYAHEINVTLLFGLQRISWLMAAAVQNDMLDYKDADISDTFYFISLVANCVEATNEISYFAQEKLLRIGIGC